jgi:hypothetical protein
MPHPADVFSGLAYGCVSDGIVRFEDRRRLARAAVRLGLRPFEAQLLIACAIRQKTLDQGRSSPTQRVPARTIQRRTTTISAWKTFALLAATAASLDFLVIYLWLS